LDVVNIDHDIHDVHDLCSPEAHHRGELVLPVAVSGHNFNLSQRLRIIIIIIIIITVTAIGSSPGGSGTR
jgi:hypothetical protein